MMKKESLGFIKDNLLNVDYELVRFNSAKELSSHLKSVLAKDNIDYTHYNSNTKPRNEWDKPDSSIITPPEEIYEYQNFFLLEKSNGDYLLLDGFRRLLWYSAPKSPILVRIYKESDLSNQEILTLLIHLNHFKFIGNSGGSYFDRGFALLLRTVFDLDILKFKETFNAYLNSNKIQNDYSSNHGEHNIETTKERILNPFFVEDIQFIDKLQQSGGMINRFFGALLYKERSAHNKPFNIDEFIKLQNENTVLVELLEKFKKTGTSSYDASQKVVNQIQDMYVNLFTLIKGGTVEKSYAEINDDCKKLSADIKKDKNWTKLTGNQNIHWIEKYMYDKLKAGEEFKFKCVIFPREASTYGRNNNIAKQIVVEPGLRGDIKLLKYFTRNNWGSSEEMEFGFEQDDKNIPIHHNYSGYNSYGKKYTEIQFNIMPTTTMKIDLYIDIPEKLAKEIVTKKWKN